MVATRRRPTHPVPNPFPALRFEVSEAAAMLRMSRAQIYIRIQQGAIRPQKDGARTYITRPELERYVEACSNGSGQSDCANPRATGQVTEQTRVPAR